MTREELAALEAAWPVYGTSGVSWEVWKAQELNRFWTRTEREVSTPNFRPETVLDGERKMAVK